MTLWGYGKGDLVEARISNKWKPCAVTGVHGRDLTVRPLDRDGGPWKISNPTRLRSLSQEALEAWLEAE